MCDSIYPDSTCPHLIFQHLKDLNHLPDTFRTTFRYPINILQIPIKYSHNIRYVWRFLFVKVRWGFLFLFLFFLSFLGGKKSQLLQGVPKKIDLLYLLNISGTKKQISKPFFSSENWDPYENFEYWTISVRYYGDEIFAKQNGILKRRRSN